MLLAEDLANGTYKPVYTCFDAHTPRMYPPMEDDASAATKILLNRLDNDPVNHPSHYTEGGIECIDAIAAALGPVGFVAFCRGNVIKYAWRADKKGKPTQDMEKADWYAKKAAEASAKVK
jgi:hypothetical protein